MYTALCKWQGDTVMFVIEKIPGEDKTEFYRELNTYLEGLLEGQTDWLAGMSNASSYCIRPWII